VKEFLAGLVVGLIVTTLVKGVSFIWRRMRTSAD